MAEGGWTHGKILGEWQQYALRRYLKLPDILPSLEKRKVISKKWGKYLAEENYDMDLFLAQLKKKNVEAFTKFFEVLEETFKENEDHKVLVGVMSEHLLQISDADPEQRERIVRVVASATGEKSLGTPLESEVGQTDISPITQTVLVGRPFEVAGTQSEGVTAPPQQPSVSQQKPEPLQIPVTEGESESPHRDEVGEEASHTMRNTGENVQPSPDQAQSQILEPQIPSPELDRGTELGQPLQSSFQITPSFPMTNQPPSGFVAPRIMKYFPRTELIDNEWYFHNAAHGISMQISGDAVPPEVDCFALQICAYLQGPFQFPEEYELCTAIFHLQVHTKTPFQFLKPVSLRIPHSALFEEDDELGDFVILRAPDPGVAIPPDSHTAEHPDYKFTDKIEEADFSSGYHVEVKLQNFSAVAGGKKKRKYRTLRSSSLPRQGSQMKGRKKKRVRKLMRQGSSIGSSRQSSLEGSFEESHSRLKHQQSPLVKQCSSVESDAPLPPRLTRQAAMDDNHKGRASPLPWPSSSLDASESCNELCICCCSPANRTDHWMTRFMVTCCHPTGMMALDSAVNNMDVEMDSEKKSVIPCEGVISFYPAEHEDGNWRVFTDRTEISLDQVTTLCRVENEGQMQMHPPSIIYSVQKLHLFSNSSLNLKIHIRGAECDGGTYFEISSKAEHSHTERELCIPSWLYPQGNKIQQSLQNKTDITLYPFDPDHCKLIADISLQLTKDKYLPLVKELAISQGNLYQLEGRTHNLPEGIYEVLTTWLSSDSVTLSTLKSVFSFTNIETNVSLPFDPGLYDTPCDENWMLELSKTISSQWRFFGRYLGVSRQKLDELLDSYNGHSLPLQEVVYLMLLAWHSQYGNDATLGVLLKTIYRIRKLSPKDGIHAWCEAEKKMSEIREPSHYD